MLFVLAQSYLQDLMKLGARGVEGVPVAAALLSPDRWLLWLGVLFVLSVYHFPSGVVGRLRRCGARELDSCAPAPPRRRTELRRCVAMGHTAHELRNLRAGREIHYTEWGCAARRRR